MFKNGLFSFLSLLLCSNTGWGFDLGMIIAPQARQKTSIRYMGMLQPRASFANEAVRSGILQTNLSASVPGYRGEANSVALSARYHWLNLYPNPSRTSDFHDIQIGASLTHRLEEKRMWSVFATFGSASDKPFEDATVNTLSATAIYSFQESETGSWLILVNYSNNRPVLNNIPLPGFAYTYIPSKTFRGTFGVPFASIYWQFIEKWSLTLFTVAPWIAKAQIAYSVQGPIQVFSGIDFSQMTYLQHGRANPKERLYYDEKKVFIGLKSPLSRILFAELETGYSFERRMFPAETYSKAPSDASELGASGYGRLGVSAAF